jgi:hypothetical protein
LKIDAQLEGDNDLAEFAAAADTAFHSGGWPAVLRKAIEFSLAQRKNESGYASPYEIAGSYAELGDKDPAFEWLNTAYREYDSELIGIRTNPAMDSLRSDPRYAELIRKIGLPQ